MMRTAVKPKPEKRPFNILDIDADDLQPAIKEVGAAIEADRRGSLQSCYRIGLAIHSHYYRLHEQQSGTNWPERGKRFFEQLGEALDYSPGWLREHFRLVAVYDQDEFAKLCKTPNMTSIKAMQLAGLESDLRAKLLKRIEKEGLSVRDIEWAIRDELGLRRNPGAGRPPMLPKTVKAALIHHNTQIDKIVNLNNQSWFCERFDIIDQINKLPAAKLSDELREYLATAKQKSEELAAIAADNAEVFGAALQSVDERRQEQAELQARADGEMDGEECPGDEARLAAAARRAENARYSARQKADRIGRELHA